MNLNTIGNDVTVVASAQSMLLVGRYRIVRQLGQGGMGSVWLAEDTQLDGKLFAIKMLPSILVSNKRAYSQLKAEALVSMRLTHPNIVTLRAFEENNGNPFLVMDYIDGQTLDDYLADRMMAGDAGRARTPAAPHGGDGTGRCAEEAMLRRVDSAKAEPEGCASIRARTPAAPLDDVVGRVVPNAPRRLEDKPPYQNALPSESEVIRILKPVAEALDYAHREGVVHRDVKPANVMIRKDGHPFILDFGIAREIQETMTRVTGKLSSGTLLYMSPEQLNGDAPKPAQDVYSFAAMVYECLTGHPPFHRGAIEDQIKNKDPEPIGGGAPGVCALPGCATAGENGHGRCAEEAQLRRGRFSEAEPEGCASIRARTPAAPSIAASVMAGLAKKPEDRPSTCAAVLVGGDCFNAETQRRRGAERAEAGLVRAEHVERVERREAGRGEIVEDRPEETNGFGKTLVGLLMFAALGGVLWFAARTDDNVPASQPSLPPVVTNVVVRPPVSTPVVTNVVVQPPPTPVVTNVAVNPPASPLPPAPSGPAEADVMEIAVEATVQRGRVERIDDADGFKVRKNTLVDLLARAVAYGKSKRWDKAAVCFTNYVDGCEALMALDMERIKARDIKNKSVAAKELAEAAGASTYAVAGWNEASRCLKSADEEFAAMRFTGAERLYESALKRFGECAEEGRAERVRQEIARLEKEPVEPGVHKVQVKKILVDEDVSSESESHPSGSVEMPLTTISPSQDKVRLWPDGPYWATRNIGAEKPEDYGYYFWWGDTVGYKCVDDSWVASGGSASGFAFTEENTPTYGESEWGLKNEGRITDDGVLAPRYDAAQAHWGGAWRMPSKQEFDAMREKCDWSWTKLNGVRGYLVRGKGAFASASIFLPAAGHGYGTSLLYAGSDGSYWSSAPYSDLSGNRYDAWGLSFSSGYYRVDVYRRFDGQSVRAVQRFTE